MDERLKEVSDLLGLYTALVEKHNGWLPGIQGMVTERLKELDKEIQDRPQYEPQVVTPPEGPANSALLDPKTGELRRLQPELTPAQIAERNRREQLEREAADVGRGRYDPAAQEREHNERYPENPAGDSMPAHQQRFGNDPGNPQPYDPGQAPASRPDPGPGTVAPGFEPGETEEERKARIRRIAEGENGNGNGDLNRRV